MNFKFKNFAEICKIPNLLFIQKLWRHPDKQEHDIIRSRSYKFSLSSFCHKARFIFRLWFIQLSKKKTFLSEWTWKLNLKLINWIVSHYSSVQNWKDGRRFKNYSSGTLKYFHEHSNKYKKVVNFKLHRNKIFFKKQTKNVQAENVFFAGCKT